MTGEESVYREYILGVRIRELPPEGEQPGSGSDEKRTEPTYRFEAPDHQGRSFEDPEMATLYADIYFDVNGFIEVGTGDRGVPPEIIQAGRDTLATYMLTQPGTDVNWVASFYGEKTSVIERYIRWVRERAEEIRAGAREQGME
jgi:hypothetical protein